jgi:hypothetical protein
MPLVRCDEADTKAAVESIEQALRVFGIALEDDTMRVLAPRVVRHRCMSQVVVIELALFINAIRGLPQLTFRYLRINCAICTD